MLHQTLFCIQYITYSNTLVQKMNELQIIVYGNQQKEHILSVIATVIDLVF